MNYWFEQLYQKQQKIEFSSKLQTHYCCYQHANGIHSHDSICEKYCCAFDFEN